MKEADILIVGGGASGIAAAVSAWDAGCRSVLLADRGSRLGGVLTQCVHRGFGLSLYGAELTGPELRDRLTGRIADTGVEIRLNTSVLGVTRDKTAVLSGADGAERVSFKHLIAAAGCLERSVGGLYISGTRPQGICTAGEAQGLINLHGVLPGRKPVILGCGDMGMIMARRFTLQGGQVQAVIEEKESYSGMARNYHRCIEAYDVPVMFSSTVTQVFGEEHICGVTVKNRIDGGELYIPCDLLIVAAGLIPDRAVIHGLEGEKWLTLCGNCNKIHSLVDSAVTEGEKAGREAYDALTGEN